MSLFEAPAAYGTVISIRDVSQPLEAATYVPTTYKEIVYHYSLRAATRGRALQWVYVSVIFARSLLARPAQGTATTVDIRCLRTLERASLLSGGGMWVRCFLPYPAKYLFLDQVLTSWVEWVE